MEPDAQHLRKRPAQEIAWTFFKLGLTSFGGPAAHVAIMEQELVTRKKWLDRERFLDLYAASQLIPGPSSTELAIHLGLVRGGLPGFFAAGLAFIVPAACLVAGFAHLYQTYGQVPGFAALLYGVKPVIAAVLWQALWSLGQAALKTRALFIVALFAATLSLMGFGELLVLLLGAGVYAAWRRLKLQAAEGGTAFWGGLTALPLLSGWEGILASSLPSLGGIFLVFLKAGSLLFGGGYVLFAFLRSDLVTGLGWLTEAQLLDAIAVGQFTPGPLFTTATFIGYLLKGPWGALVATVGIFLPAFIAVALTAPFIPRLRASPSLSAVLDGLNVASLALMALATASLSQHSLRDLPSIIIASLSLLLLVRWRVSSSYLVIAGGVLGYLLKGGAGSFS